MNIIIPIYNSEKYISECLNSILTDNNVYFEVICVDDASIDGSQYIVERIKDRRLRYLRKANRGGSSARNTGIKAAKGQYITFVDSDDYVDCTYINSIFEHIQNNLTSLVLFNHHRTDGKTVKKTCLSKEELYRYACEQRLNALMWYKKS